MEEIERIEDPIFSIFDRPIIDRSIAAWERHEYQNTDNATTVEGLANKKIIRFRVDDRNAMIDLSEAALHLRMQVWDHGNDAVFGVDDNIAPINDIGVQFFDNFELKIDNQTVCQQNDYAGLGAYVMGALGYTRDYSATSASNEFWHQDTGAGGTELGSVNVTQQPVSRQTAASATTAEARVIAVAPGQATNTADLTNAAHWEVIRVALAGALATDTAVDASPLVFNKGHKERWERTRGGKIFSVWVPLRRYFGFLKDFKKVIYGRSVEVVLRRRHDDNETHDTLLLRAAGVADGRIRLHSANLWIPQVRPSLESLATLTEGLQSNRSVPLVYRDWTVERSSADIQPDKANYRYDFAFKHNKPTRIIVFFQNSNKTRLQGANFTQTAPQTLNSGTFDNRRITQMYVEIEKRRYPYQQLDIQFDETSPNADWGRAYAHFLDASMSAYPLHGAAVSLQEFKDMFSLFCFDVSNKDNEMWDPKNAPQVSIHFKREPETGGTAPTAADAGPFQMYAIMEYERDGLLSGVSGETRFSIK